MKYQKIVLDEKEELIIPKRAKKFLLGCCNCGLKHLVTINRKGKEIVMKFERWK